MARFITTTIANGQSVETTKELWVKSVELVGGAADAVAKIYGNGVEEIRIAAKAGSTEQIMASKGNNDFDSQHVPMPVTCDLSGTGAWLKINY